MVKNFYGDNVFLGKDSSLAIYNQIKDMPIIDYHCHLQPKEIYEDKPFDNIGEIWLGGDHYKWRLMRGAGIDEKYITGDSTWKEKFINYAAALELALGNPLYHWSHMELKQFFGINEPLTSENAEEIWDKANAVIKETKMSPRKLIADSDVEYIATTDDIIDTLEYHKLIAEDKSFKAKVAPSFRTDNLFLYTAEGYNEYIEKLSVCSGVDVKNLSSLKEALEKRVEFFVSMGCKMTDVGIERFPEYIGSDEEADKAFKKALLGEILSEKEYDSFISNVYLFLGGLYKKHNLIMQLHLAVKRNASTKLFEKLGRDVGGDCVGNPIKVSAITALLDKMEIEDKLPTTIVYTLNPTIYYEIATGIRSFRNVSLGAAWWFCDNLSGIKKQLEVYSETSAIGTFYGMLTDSRSFLSYARHDYFRRILADFLGNAVENGEFAPFESAVKIAKNVAYNNIKNKLSE
ncbi:MAG: glucuronate isomerase [Ruminococcaceae bacterium]|nr:glucuronate isomerase [Oscillospiraceae bacterium]